MLLGRNGSGKSTILSALSPYKESLDERKNLILDGEDRPEKNNFRTQWPYI